MVSELILVIPVPVPAVPVLIALMLSLQADEEEKACRLAITARPATKAMQIFAVVFMLSILLRLV